MLGGIIFVIVVWFLPILIWYFVQGRKELTAQTTCEQKQREQKVSRNMFYGALGFGVLIIILILIFGR